MKKGTPLEIAFVLLAGFLGGFVTFLIVKRWDVNNYYPVLLAIQLALIIFMTFQSMLLGVEVVKVMREG